MDSLNEWISSSSFCHCNETVLDYQLLWNTTIPRFNRCFQHTIPTLVPAIFLCIFFPIQLYRILFDHDHHDHHHDNDGGSVKNGKICYKNKKKILPLTSYNNNNNNNKTTSTTTTTKTINQPIPINGYNLSRIFLVTIIIMVNGAQLCYDLYFSQKSHQNFHNHQSLSPQSSLSSLSLANYLYTILNILTFTLFGIMLHIHRVRAIHTSGVAWIFTLISWVTMVPTLYMYVTFYGDEHVFDLKQNSIFNNNNNNNNISKNINSIQNLDQTTTLDSVNGGYTSSIFATVVNDNRTPNNAVIWNIFHLICFAIHFLSIFSLFILTCFADHRPINNKIEDLFTINNTGGGSGNDEYHHPFYPQQQKQQQQQQQYQRRKNGSFLYNNRHNPSTLATMTAAATAAAVTTGSPPYGSGLTSSSLSSSSHEPCSITAALLSPLQCHQQQNQQQQQQLQQNRKKSSASLSSRLSIAPCSGRQQECPDQRASFLSLLTYWWFNRMAVKGYRKGLTLDDLWCLNPKDTTSYIAPRFDHSWISQVVRIPKRLDIATRYDCDVEFPSLERFLGCAAAAASAQQQQQQQQKSNVPNNKNAKVKDSKNGDGDHDSVDVQFRIRSNTFTTNTNNRNRNQRQHSQNRHRQPDTFVALMKTFSWSLARGALCKMIFDLLQFVSPFLLKIIIQFVSKPSKEEPLWHGLLISSLFFLSSTTQSMLINAYFHRMFLLGMRVQTALISAIYRKSLNLSNSALSKTTTGEIVNLMSVDAQRFVEQIPYINLIWSCPLQLILIIYFLYQELGISVIVGMCLVALLIPINWYFTTYQRKLQIKQMTMKDERVKVINETITGIRVIKLYGWEVPFLEKISTIRNKEIVQLREIAYVNTITSFIWTSAPFLVSFSTFAAYVLLSPENLLNAKKAFVSVSLFNMIQFPLSMLPRTVTSLVMLSISVKRLNRFLNSPMLKEYVTRTSLNNGDTNGDGGEKVIVIRDGNFCWNLPDNIDSSISTSIESMTMTNNSMISSIGGGTGNGGVGVGGGGSGDTSLPGDISSFQDNNSTSLDVTIATGGGNGCKKNPNPAQPPTTPPTTTWLFTLANINLTIYRGTLTAIVGNVGSGKSSLLSAILGEMERLGGTVEIDQDESVAYVAQQAWIRNATLRENILFGSPYDQTRYGKVIQMCALQPDIAMLPGGDETEIGEKGINLSGGQKQRVAIARACYANRSLILLDDPLSAVDSHVARHIFDQVLSNECGYLRDCTRVLVTNNISFLPHVDQVICVSQGVITECGTYQELIDSNGSFSLFINEHLHSSSNTTTKTTTPDTETLRPAETEEKEEVKDQAESKPEKNDMEMMISPNENENDDAIPLDENDTIITTTTTTLTLSPVSLLASTSTPLVPPPPLIILSPSTDGQQQQHPHHQNNHQHNHNHYQQKLRGKNRDENRRKLIKKEHTETGHVKPTVYLHYFQSLTYIWLIGWLVGYIGIQSSSVGSNVWLAIWSNDHPIDAHHDDHSGGIGDDHSQHHFINNYPMIFGNETRSVTSTTTSTTTTMLPTMLNNRTIIDEEEVLMMKMAMMKSTLYQTSSIADRSIEHNNNNNNNTHAIEIENRNYRLTIFGLFGLAQTLFVLFSAIAKEKAIVRSSMTLHHNLLNSIMHSPMQFFDTTPLGRIMNRFAKDIDAIDHTIPNTVHSWLLVFLQVISTLLLITAQIPFFLCVVIPIIAVYHFIQKFYVATSRQLKRLESVTRSPIYSHFSETLSGVTTIRAFGATRCFIGESNYRMDTNQRCYYPSFIDNRWIGVRLEFLGNLITLSTAIFSVLLRDTFQYQTGYVGLIISYSLHITMTLNWFVRMTSEMETNIVSVERIGEYCDNEQEREWIREKNQQPYLSPQWPPLGGIQFKNYSVRYRDGLDLVLTNISLQIYPSEKIGIVGRTGSGKSTLTLALFRVLEATQGCIEIDDVNIAQIGLHELRSKLSIIPQDPVLFSGTIRSNLDPLSSHSDDQLWRALEHAHLREYIASLGSGLDYVVEENGANLSVGQRQLICLARALLRRTRILVLDEATAAIDLETDALIQDTIRQEFAHATVLTIAHRLHTIMDSDRVLVMDHGRVAEFDTPATLLADTETRFYALAKDARLV